MKTIKEYIPEVGDRFIVRIDLKAGQSYGNLMFVESQKRYCNQEVEVESLHGFMSNAFKIKGCVHNWTIEMMDCLVVEDDLDKIKPTFKNTLLSKHGNYYHISNFLELTRQTGYKYYEWNDKIYEYDGDEVVDTGFLFEDLR